VGVGGGAALAVGVGAGEAEGEGEGGVLEVEPGGPGGLRGAPLRLHRHVHRRRSRQSLFLCSRRRRWLLLLRLGALCGRERRRRRRQAGYSRQAGRQDGRCSHRSPAVKGHDGTTRDFTHEAPTLRLISAPPLRF
jgi:hypothetical protein